MFCGQLFWISVNVAINLSSEALRRYKSTFDTPALLSQCRKRDPLMRHWFTFCNIIIIIIVHKFNRGYVCVVFFKSFTFFFAFVGLISIFFKLKSCFMKDCRCVCLIVVSLNTLSCILDTTDHWHWSEKILLSQRFSFLTSKSQIFSDCSSWCGAPNFWELIALS